MRENCQAIVTEKYSKKVWCMEYFGQNGEMKKLYTKFPKGLFAFPTNESTEQSEANLCAHHCLLFQQTLWTREKK